jgi:methylenetetrahydrofolate reductase (NADPH)
LKTEAMKIAEALATVYPSFSFEFFAPPTDEGVPQLMRTIRRLKRLAPLFVSVTYSLGEERRRRTIEVVARTKRELGIEAMAHLTCVGASREAIRARLDELAASGIENVLALRGDPPKDSGPYTPSPDGFGYSSDLTAFVRSNYEFSIGGACYPQVHPDSATMEEDLANLVKKVEAGAQFLITQAFFENVHYFAFVERARAAGIRVPIIPGIMPITNMRVIQNIITLDPRTTVPRALQRELSRREDNPKSVLELGVAYAALQCEELLRGGAPGIHFYTLNTSPATSAILAALRITQPWLNAPQGVQGPEAELSLP